MLLSAFAATLALVTLTTAGLSQDRPPNIDLARAVEDQTIAIRLFNTAEKDTISHGTGFLIQKFDDNQDVAEDSLTFATAAHVIDGHDEPGIQLQIRYRDQNRWVEAKVDLQTDLDTDLAVITVPRRDAAVDRGRPQQIANAPYPGDGKDAWIFGYDRTIDQLAWRRLWTSRERGNTIELTGPGLEPGFSGGMIVSQIGRIGLIQSRGAAGEADFGIRTGAMASVFDAAEISHNLHADLVLEALMNARSKGLAIALYCLDGNNGRYDHFWAAIDLTEDRTDGAVVGLAVVGGGPTRGGEPRVTIQPITSGLSLSFEQQLQWRPGRSGDTIESQQLEFAVDSEITLDGFVILRSDAGEDIIYMAVPAANAELLPARALLSSVIGNATHADLGAWGASARILLADKVNESGTVHGAIVPFSILIPGDPRSSQIPFSVQRTHAFDQPIVIRGTWFLPDKLLAGAKIYTERPQNWSVDVRSLGTDAQRPLKLGQPGQYFEHRVSPAGDAKLVFIIDEGRRNGIPNRKILIVAPVITYEALGRAAGQAIP